MAEYRVRSAKGRVGKLAPACFATYVESLSPRQPRSLAEVGPAELMPGRHGGISPVTDDGNHRGCTRARPPRGDRAL